MRQIFISSVQKEFEKERAAIKRMIETDPLIKPHFKAFVFEIDAPASDKTTRQVYFDEIAKSDVYLVIIGNKYGFCRGDEPSPTEQEYDEASRLGLKKLVMVRGMDNSQREERETAFLNRVSDGRVRVRYQDATSENPQCDLLDEVRNSIRDIMIDDGIISEVPFEDQSPNDVSLDDISEDRIRWFIKEAIRIRKANYKPDMPVVDVLRTLHLLNRRTGLPTNAAVLLFGKDSQYFFQSSQVKCAYYPGLEKEKPNGDISLLEGDLFLLADQALAYVKGHIDNGAGEHKDGASAEDTLEIPNAVIAEAINNAIAHRNYSSPGSIQIEVYKDRVEIINPGRLHPALTIEDLYKKHESYPPNARIAHALYQVKYIEALGTGITDMLRRCKKAGLRKPRLEELSGRFRIVIWRRDMKREALRENAGLLETLILAKLKTSGQVGLKLANLQQLMPDLPRSQVQSVMRKLQKAGKIFVEGKTSSAKWYVVGDWTCNKTCNLGIVESRK